jgi:hypothetical protein
MRIFFAYPASPPSIAACIREAADQMPRRAPGRAVQLWERNDIAGRPITDPVFSHLDETDILFADITQTNFNVAFEIGYAISVKKRVFLVRNKGFTPGVDFSKIGIFDTLGYQGYENALQLLDILSGNIDTAPLAIAPRINWQTPLFVLETPVNSDPMLRIIARITNQSVI